MNIIKWFKNLFKSEEDKNINDYVFLFEQMNVRFYLTYIYLSILFIIILINIYTKMIFELKYSLIIHKIRISY